MRLKRALPLWASRQPRYGRDVCTYKPVGVLEPLHDTVTINTNSLCLTEDGRMVCAALRQLGSLAVQGNSEIEATDAIVHHG